MSDYLQDRLVAAVGDHYLIEAEIGRGGMAAVYRALDLRLNRHVAIKLLPPDLAFNADVKERFLREAQLAAQLNHPNIVPIYSVDERDGVVFFVMALVEGVTLAQHLHEVGRSSFDEVRQVIGEVADALDYAHRKGVVHRDIKPDNIMLDRASGRTMVTDFGIARAAEGGSRLTVTGVAVGTPAYMSPEQARGERDIDGRADIYSLGVVAYQMLTGEQPFKAANTPAMLVKHVSETPRPIVGLRADVPAPIAYAVERAMAKDPEARWPSGAAFRDAIRATVVKEEPARQQPRAAQLAATGLVVSPPRNLNREELRDWTRELRERALEFREQRQQWRDDMRAARDEQRLTRREQQGERRAAHREANRDHPERPMEERVAAFRRRMVSSLSTVVVLFGINIILVPEFWWWVFPAAGLTVELVARWVNLWSDGATFRQLFRRGRGEVPASAAPPGLEGARPAPRVLPAAAPIALPPLVSDDVLAGPHGGAARRAQGDRIVIRELLASLTPTERAMLPDIEPTVSALSERIAALANTLHALDSDASGANLGQLDQRIAMLQQEAETPERMRRLELLQRQRTTVHDLLERRGRLLPRLESACSALHNLKLDLLKVRSAGIDSALGDVTSATQQARALSRDIGHVMDAVDEVRNI